MVSCVAMASVSPQIHIDGDRVRVPADALHHAGFRVWVKSAGFPEGARATYARGEVFVEVSPEAAETHNKVKSAITADLVHLIRAKELGETYSDGMLLTHAIAEISTEPDFLFASWEAFETGRLRLVEKANRQDDYVELEGAPDLVVEILSDSSETKDLVVLREGYFDAGIPEYWVIDARGEAVRFQILSRTSEGYVTHSASSEAQRSIVLGRSFRIERSRNRAGRWEYRLVPE